MSRPLPIRLLAPPLRKGDFFTRLVADLLEAQGFEVRRDIHKPGREIDIEAKHRREERWILAECKAEVEPAGGADVHKFVGTLITELGARPRNQRSQVTGYFVALAGFRETEIEQRKSRDGALRLIYLNGHDLLQELVSAGRVVSPGRALEQAGRAAAGSPLDLAAEERLELLAHEKLGWVWAVRYRREGRPSHVALVDAQGKPLEGGEAESVLRADQEVEGDLHGLAYLPGRLRKAGVSAADLDEAERRYLAHLADKHHYLQLKGMGLNNLPYKLPLLKVYVPLYGRPRGAGEGEEPLESWRAVVTRRRTNRVPVLDLLQKSPGLVVLGHPGSGKSTVLKSLALRLAGGDWEPLGLGRRLPILVGLADYGAVAGQVPFARFFQDHFQGRLQCPLPFEAMLERALAEGRALFLLDGLDEVREEAARYRMAQVVEDLYSFHRAGGNRFVITSRIVGYVPLAAPGIAEVELEDFDDGDIEAFLSKWLPLVERSVGGEGPVAEERARREREELWQAFRRNRKVRELASNPLLLTILASIQRQGVTLPERRVELYQLYVKVLLRDWHLARGVGGTPQPATLNDQEALRILGPLALWMQKVAPGRGRVEEAQLRRELRELFLRQADSKEEAEAEAESFLARLQGETSLLAAVGLRQYAFLHLTFQEYLAATAVARQGREGLVRTLAEHLGEPEWREVNLLALASFALSQNLGMVLEDLFALPREPAGESVFLAVEALLDVGLRTVDRESRVRAVAALLELMRDEGLAASVRARAGEVLAELGDPRPEVMTLEGIVGALCEVPEGPFVMGSEEEDKLVAGKERPKHTVKIPYSFRISRYPVTVAQFREYLGVSRRVPKNPNCLYGLENAPVVQVSWDEALEFCVWLTQKWRENGWLEAYEVVTLPSEAEWEKAARGTDGRIFSWGNEFDANRANQSSTGLHAVSPVGCFSGGKSPFGCEEMIGNVWEWTRSLWGERVSEPTFHYPYRVEDGREDLGAPPAVRRVARGGSFVDGLYHSSCCTTRVDFGPQHDYRFLGFRVLVHSFHLN